LLAAFMLLTRLPVARLSRGTAVPDIARSAWAFPIVGLAVNGIGAVVYWLAHKAGMPPLLAAAWALTVTLIATGGLHEDGLADTADGFGGGVTPARKLEIMRDSRIGSYGALALLLSTLVRTAAIAGLESPHRVMIGWIVAGMLGRAGMLALVMLLRPVRDDGMGASMGKAPASSVAIAFGLAIAASWILLPIRPAAMVVVLGSGAPLAVAKLARAQVGGYTGDVLGACEVVVECVVLTAAACAFIL
jgi:adenosylcobinamide-GDP ribazoletransferase